MILRSVIEDDIRVAELLKRGLQESGYKVLVENNISDGFNMFDSDSFDIIISDVMLPDGTGFELCRQIREKDDQIPILMLTALGTTDDKLEGFHSGADDYMVKPFDFRELNARIGILLKRRHSKNVEYLEYADIRINLKKKLVTRNGQLITLTPKEFNLLQIGRAHV